jgi:hypothetical protein
MLSPFEAIYVWTRHDGDVFRVRFSMDAAHKITVLEDFTPSSRSTTMIPQRGLTVRNYYHTCEFFDSRNFVCRSSANEDYIMMIDGVLSHQY